MDNFSVIFAERLRSLRLERGISLKSLADELNSRYSYEISAGSRTGKRQTISEAALKAYEAGENNSRSGDNKGMRAEYLLWLADFYDVSTDYLLGRTDIQCPVTNVRAIVAETGLSEHNVISLTSEKKDRIHSTSEFLNDILDINDIIPTHILLKEQSKSFKNDGKKHTTEVNWHQIITQYRLYDDATKYGLSPISQFDYMRFLTSEIGNTIAEALRKKYIPGYDEEK